MEFRYVELKSGRRIKRYKANCPTCGKDRGFKDKNHLSHECNKCANNKIAKSNIGRKASLETREKQSKAALKRYNDPSWEPVDRSNKGYSNINSTRIYTIKNTPEQNKLKHRMRTLLHQKLKRRNINKNYKSTFDATGYSVEELKKHLENQFKPGMTWDNYGEWHIDHVTPDCHFNYNSLYDIEFKKSWSLDNLQPLWAEDNWKKGSKIGGDDA